ncbi:MAG TPA: response regulator transcription factor [Solirubrobacteraceae bacterium]|jgi:DNA-binding NarL/FixJ family response regulator
MRSVRHPPGLERRFDPARAAAISRLPGRESRIVPRNHRINGSREDQVQSSLAVIRLALVGGGQLMRGATANLLAAQDGFVVMGNFESVADFLACDMPEPPAVLLLDCDGDGANPRSAVSVLSRTYAAVKLVLLCGDVTAEIVRCAMEYGVSGVLLKSYTAEDVRHAIRYMASGRTILPAGWQQAAGSIQRDPLLLSPRLRQILALVAQGLSNDKIAAQLGLSPNTVKFHVRALYARLGVHNRVEASIFYAQLTRGGG